MRKKEIKKQNYAKGELRNEREQASSNEASPSQKQKSIAVVKTHTNILHRGSLSHELKLFTFTNYLYLKRY